MVNQMSENKNDDSTNCTGRRDFLKSLLGFSKSSVKNTSKSENNLIASFYWSDLRTGQVGFPTGLAADHGLPGSIMKLITTACLCQEGKSERRFDCTGTIAI